MKKTILLVDDFENTRWVIESTLKKVECEILKADNGKEALKKMDGRIIDLVITDINMPEMNGLELIANIKNSAYKMVPIIVLSTDTQQDKKQKAMDLKITMWMQKPYKTDDLLKIVKKCLNIN